MVIRDLIRLDHLDSMMSVATIEIELLQDNIRILEKIDNKSEIEITNLNKIVKNLEIQLEKQEQISNRIDRKLRIAKVKNKIFGGSGILLAVLVVILIL